MFHIHRVSALCCFWDLKRMCYAKFAYVELFLKTQITQKIPHLHSGYNMRWKKEYTFKNYFNHFSGGSQKSSKATSTPVLLFEKKVRDFWCRLLVCWFVLHLPYKVNYFLIIFLYSKETRFIFGIVMSDDWSNK